MDLNMFKELTAWFSSSVDAQCKQLWRDHGGSEALFDKAQFIFSSDNTCPDTERVFNSSAYESDHLAVFHSSYITDSVQTRNRTKVIIGQYVLPPTDIYELIKEQMSFCWETPCANFAKLPAAAHLQASAPEAQDPASSWQPHHLRSSPGQRPWQSSDRLPAAAAHRLSQRQDEAHRPGAGDPQKRTSRSQSSGHTQPVAGSGNRKETNPSASQSQKRKHASPPHADTWSKMADHHEPTIRRDVQTRTGNATNALQRERVNATGDNQIDKNSVVYHISQLNKVCVEDLVDFIPGSNGAQVIKRGAALPC